MGTCGEELAVNPMVDKTAFTGSTEVGRRIMQLASGTVKPVTLELGGKSANIVFADADLDTAAASAPMSFLDNAGQDCCARSRILVQRSVFDRFMELLEPAVKGVVVGDPADPGKYSRWPDFKPGGRPRSATVVIRKRDGGVIGS